MNPNESPTKQASQAPEPDHFDAALTHLNESIGSNSIAASAAKGILYAMTETLGTLVGDPNLPDHARTSYEGLLEIARELRAKLGH